MLSWILQNYPITSAIFLGGYILFTYVLVHRQIQHRKLQRQKKQNSCFRQLPLVAQMQLRMRLLLPHRDELVHPLSRSGQAWPFAAKTCHDAELNFAGGKPFLYPKFMTALPKYGGKVDLNIESISIISNGPKIAEAYLYENAPFIDILAISCDSFNPETNLPIWRGKSGQNVEQMRHIASWCRRIWD